MPGQAPFRLRALGSGSAFSRRYGTTCSVLTLTSGRPWLIDCGRQAPEQLERAQLDWHDLAGQLVTHVHGDHVYGLEEFAFVRYYESRHAGRAVMQGGPRPALVAHGAVRAELWEFLGPSLRYRSDARGNPVPGVLTDYFDVLPPTSTEAPEAQPWNHSELFLVDGCPVAARETQHVIGKPSTTFEIGLPDQCGRLAWWSGDSVVDSGLLQAIEPRTNIFFHDCSFAEYPGQVHGMFRELSALPQSVRTKMVLMHHDDDVESHRQQAESLGFRLCLPGDCFDLLTGQKVQS